MIIEGYEFYGTPKQGQGALIAEINRAFNPPVAQVRGGMCYMLSMQFLLDYLRNQGAVQSEAVFDRITGDYAYLRQVAGNYREYIEHGFASNTVGELTELYIHELSRGYCQALPLGTFSTSTLPASRLDHQSKGHLIVFYFKNADGSETYGHAVAVVRDGPDYCLYDPNYGIFRTRNPDEIYGAVLPRLYNPKYLHGELFGVSKQKLD